MGFLNTIIPSFVIKQKALTNNYNTNQETMNKASQIAYNDLDSWKGTDFEEMKTLTGIFGRLKNTPLLAAHAVYKTHIKTQVPPPPGRRGW